MNRKLEDYIYHKNDFLSKSYCDDLVHELNVAKWKYHEWYNVNTGDFFSVKHSPMTLKDSHGYTDITKKIDEAVNSITDRMRPVVIEYINHLNFEWFTGWDGYTSIKLFQYSPEQEMDSHWDNIRDIFDGERKGVPIFSIVGALNNDYSGGEFIMFDDYKIEIKQGDVILFPSTFLYPHKVSPVTEGIRYSYVSWGW